MITKKEFTELIESHINWSSRVDNINNILGIGISMYNIDIIDYGAVLFEKTLDILFDDIAIDNIDWWLYEKQKDNSKQMWDNDDNIIPTETIEDLWNLVKDGRK